jgi:hypothetical protein
MDVLSVGGKDYVKASVIARDLGYTADYVGQLCRNRKVNAKLVGRTWYVDRNSIHIHKENRYRSTQSKSVESLKESIEVANTEERGTAIPIRIAHTSHATTRIVKKPVYTSYLEDEAELIPEVSKAGVSIPVELADAKAVKITSKKDEYVFETPTLEPIRFHGKLNLSNIEDETAEADTKVKGAIFHPRWNYGKGGKKAQNLAISSIPVHVEKESQTSEISEIALEEKVLLRHETSATHIQVKGEDVEEEVLIEEERVVVSKPFLFAVAASSALLVLLLLGAESHVSITGETISTSYSFAFENLSASAYSAIEGVESIFYIVEFSTSLFIF